MTDRIAIRAANRIAQSQWNTGSFILAARAIGRRTRRNIL